jgi:streptogramin lyase
VPRSETPHLSGTVDYTAPEQVAGEPSGPRSDVYSLGCVLYECLVGEPPFRRARASATLFAHSSEPPPSVHAKRPELLEAIDPVIARALAKEAEERYESCRELVEAAREALGLGAARLTRRRLLAASAGVVALAAGGAVAAVLLSRRDERAAAPSPAVVPVTANSLVRIDPATNRAVVAVPVGAGPERVAVGEGSVWVANTTDRILVEVDPKTNVVLRTVDVARVGRPTLLAAGEGAVWIADRGPGVAARELWRYDPQSGELAALPTVRIAPFGIAVGLGSVWITDALSSAVLRIDPRSGAVTGAFPLVVSGSYPDVSFPVVGAGAVWFVDLADRIVRVDPVRNEVVAGIELGDVIQLSYRVAVGEEGLWFTRPDDDEVVRVDPSTGRVVDLVRVGRVPREIAVGGGAVWVANGRDGTVTRIDPGTLDTTVVEIGGSLRDLEFGEGAVWVTAMAP